ncbi:hypothetical protein ERO13_D11G339650v2 [Gossypium hirsutum]|uniref:Uncharacterized protein n=3 Tax=Gossypium TaxID=3633 RepID=A0A0D2SQK6_GOSRA|nr:hypothetical protein ERO13_D11G339650v2 [Gossypium hirsutum]KJB46449.1 hypothetical protein B456_007G369200 [Gossypium raimondii]TYH47339.1 hypothetical protein ES332_D11G404500v1 [Gossypium tomentosum]TYI58810.1 hypothetical protein E1A91_D11G387700v1 [Gossypium mustelinum]
MSDKGKNNVTVKMFQISSFASFLASANIKFTWLSSGNNGGCLTLNNKQSDDSRGSNVTLSCCLRYFIG